VSDANLVRFRAAVAGALAHLESRREEVNDLNVFPVADGDTGDNMALTLRAVVAELDRLQGSNGVLTIDEIGREEIVQSVARAALLGARGNSGVILSQLIRGAAEELVSRPGELIDATLIGAALANAADRGYASVREPAEGTILTVAREMAHKIMTDVAHSAEGLRLGPATDPGRQDTAIADTLERALAAGEESVRRSPELLSALREAGVVDAGGYGLTIMFAGVVAALRGEDPPSLEHHAPAPITHPEHSSSTYRFCTNFAVTGEGLSAGRFIAPLERLGDSVLVVGDANTLKVHVHTDQPERATEVFAAAGQISRLDIADMRTQVAEREHRLHAVNGAGPGGSGAGAPVNGSTPNANGASPRGEPAGPSGKAPVHDGGAAAYNSGAIYNGGAAVHNGDAAVHNGDAAKERGDAAIYNNAASRNEDAGSPHANGARPVGKAGPSTRTRCGTLAVVGGEGVAAMFRALGVCTIDGGPTLNPSTYELLAAIHDVPAEEVLVLPGSPNVVMAAERAAELSDKLVLVAPAVSQQAGLVAAVALEHDRSVEENAAALRQALAHVRTGAVAPAARDDAQGRFARGDAVGFVADQVHAWGNPAQTLSAVIERLAQDAELISGLEGADAPLAREQVEAIAGADVELELHDGGQRAYWWLLAAE
jgi:dihydroxyacetone kinase-like predicted kinase